MDISIIINQVLIMFLLSVTGYLFYKKKFISYDTCSQISSILVKIIMPLIIVEQLAIPFNSKTLYDLVLSFLLSGLSFIIAIIISKIIFKSNNEIEQFALVFSNSAFMGIPLVSSILGNKGLIYLVPFIILFNLLTWTYGVKIFDPKTKLNIQELVKNPVIIAFAIGLIIFFLNIPVHYSILKSLNYLTSLNTPLAMIVLGCYVAQLDFNKLKIDSLMLKVVLGRLIIIPIITLAILIFLVPINNSILKATVFIASCCPVAASAAMFSQLFNKNFILAATYVAITTVVSMISLPIILTLINYL